MDWKKEITRAIALVILAALVAAGVNTMSSARIAWVGTWPSTFGADTAAVPPSYTQDDPPILRLDEAVAKFQSAGAVFLDARDSSDFVVGHIPQALNLPFDYYDEHAGAILPQVPKDAQIVTYCGGADCELSLYLARQLRQEGYTNLFIFFGGYVAWEAAGMPVDKEAAS